VARRAELQVGDSRYTFEPGSSVDLRIRVDFAGIGTEVATWDGRATTFVREIAWARTFGFARDASLLLSSGRALGVDPRSVMVLDEVGQVMPPGLPRRPGELARHKLLDLVGDLYLGGGPPIGRISAVRPGHGATRSALLSAVEEGIITRALPGRALVT
jgi:UDP-3-O-[3-hydroxymyristoyl] N-acetylglucosamine deacetylase